VIEYQFLGAINWRQALAKQFTTRGRGGSGRERERERGGRREKDREGARREEEGIHSLSQK